jgi:proteasome lid subunit RPN8/RPN11
MVFVEGSIAYRGATAIIERLRPELAGQGYEIHVLSAEAADGRQFEGISIAKLISDDVEIRVEDAEGRLAPVEPALLERILLAPAMTSATVAPRPDGESAALPSSDPESVVVGEPETVAPAEQPHPTPAPPDAAPRRVRVKIWGEALAKARQHAGQHLSYEVGGIVMGRVSYMRAARQWLVEVTDTFQAEHTVNRGASITFTIDTWSAANRRIDQEYASRGQRMVGWYHTHPGFGIFLSAGYDLFIHENFFTQPWHVALVIDPRSDTWGFFTWEGEPAAVARCPNELVEIVAGAYADLPAEQAAPPPAAPPAPSAAPEPAAGAADSATESDAPPAPPDSAAGEGAQE